MDTGGKKQNKNELQMPIALMNTKQRSNILATQRGEKLSERWGRDIIKGIAWYVG